MTLFKECPFCGGKLEGISELDGVPITVCVKCGRPSSYDEYELQFKDLWLPKYQRAYERSLKKSKKRGDTL
jgi:hypothetical protein